MNNQQPLPPALEFLSWIIDTSKTKYQTAPWLLNDFHAEVWQCLFLDTPRLIDWGVQLPNGKILSKDYKTTVIEFKSWLTLQTHPDATGGRSNLPITSFHKISEILRLIDFLILNNSRYGVLENGISTLTANDLKSILSAICLYGKSADSVYQWKKSLTQFAIRCIEELPLDIFQKVLDEQSEISKIDIIQLDRLLDLSDDQLVKFRAWLWWKNYYVRNNHDGYQYQVRPKKLSKAIYIGTIWAEHTSFTSVPELSFSSVERYTREYSAVAVRTSLANKVNEQRLEILRSAIKSLGFLANIGITIPADALEEFSQAGWLSTIDIKPSGRFSTVPQDIVFDILRKSIDFILDFGDALVDAYLIILKEAQVAEMNIFSFCSANDIKNYIGEKLQAKGVSTWILGQTMSLEESNPARNKSERAPASEFFRRFKANEGLFDLLQVLYGSIQIVIGILTARRQAELMELTALGCLDSSEQYLIFHNRKSGIDGMRERELRPIPPIATKMIKILQRLQLSLSADELLLGSEKLFSPPHKHNLGLSTVSSSSYNRTIDRACDYHEIGINDNGERFYLRQHLLRRFFATLFFWGKSFGGMDTLRWFLGHTDIQHLYHYITDSTPGAVLRWTKALYVSSELKTGASDFDLLADILESRFNTRNFSLLDSDELTEYIDHMIADEEISVEPVFFGSGQGKDFKILVKILQGACE